MKVQQRSIVTCIVLTIVTCGLYLYYWLYCLNEDMNATTNEQGTPGATVVLLTLVTCGIYLLYWMYVQGERIDRLKTQRGIPSSNTGIIYLVLSFVGAGFVSFMLLQHELNNLLA